MEEILAIINRLSQLRDVIMQLDLEQRTEENEVYREAVEKIKYETLNLVAALSTSKLEQLKGFGEGVIESVASVIPKERLRQIGEQLADTLSEGLGTVRRAGSKFFRGLGEALDPDKSEEKEGT